MRLSALLTGFCSACCAAAMAASDLGALGPVYPIAEQDFAQLMMQRARGAQEDGSWQRNLKKHSAQLAKNALVASGGLPRARQSRTYTLDPSVTLERPLRRADGSILYAAGTRINPLDYVRYQRRICFFDGNDRAQLDWLREHCPQAQDKRIAVEGDVRELETEFGRVYLDQEGRLLERFKLTELPAKVRAVDKLFHVEVFAL